MADPFRVEPKGKSWADIVEEDEQFDLLNSQHEESPLASKEESNEESDAAPQNAASATPSASDQQADGIKEEKPAKVVLTGSSASKWASAPSEPREPTKSLKVGSMASKWASAPDSPSPSRSRYDSNRQNRHDTYNRFGGNGEPYSRNTGLPRNNRWQEDPPSSGRLNRSAFEDEDTRNGGFSNKANFSREKRYQEYHELTNKEVEKDEAPEHKKAIKSWNAYKPPAEENEETAKQLVKAASKVEQTTTDQTTKEEPQDAPIAQKEDSKETEVSPTKAVEPVKPTISSSPSLKPVSSFSWADDIPDDNSDDDSDYPIPADWITPKLATPANTAQVQGTSATPPAVENDNKKPATDDLSPKTDSGAKTDEAKFESSQPTKDTDLVDTASVATAAALSTDTPPPPPKKEAPTSAWGALNDHKEPTVTHSEGGDNANTASLNDTSPEQPEEPVQPSCNEESTTAASATEEASASPPAQASKEETPTYTWGALNDYKEPEKIAPKSEEVIKMDKEQEKAAVAAWNSARLPEEPEEKADAATIEDEKSSWNEANEKTPSWNQANEETPPWHPEAEEQPSWNQSAEPSWNQPTETSWNQPDKEEPKAAQQDPASEPKPTYTWGALDDYKEPEVIAKPKSDTVTISKEDEKAAISAWNSIKLPEVPETKEDKPQEPVNYTPSWNSAAQNPEPVKAASSWNANAQESEPVKAGPSWNTISAEPSWNTNAQPTSWGAVEQPSWSETSTAAAESNTPQQQQQDWSSNSFQEGSSVTSKSSYKDTWRNKLPTKVDDNTGGWRSFAETVAVPPEPAPQQKVQEPAPAVASRESTFKRTERGSAASKWSHDRYNDAKLVHTRPSQRKPHDLSFKLNDFKEATNNEVHVSWKDIKAQDSPKISIKDDTSTRQVTVGLSEFSRANPQQDIVLRLSDITADRPPKDPQQKQNPQQHQGPQEVILSFSEFNKSQNEASTAWTSVNPVPAANISTNSSSSSGPKEIVCKLSDFARKDKTDEPMDITLKLF